MASPGTTQSSSPKLTLKDLPPEIVLQITEHVEDLSIQDHHRLSHPDDTPPGQAGGALGGAGDALLAMMNGLFGGALGANGAGGLGAGAGGGGAGAVRANAGNANAANPFAFGGPNAANPFAPAAPPASAVDAATADTDGDMPPLEPLPSTRLAATTASTSNATARPADDSDNDGMPPLESIDDTTPAPADSTSAASGSNPFSFFSALTNPLFGGRNPSSTAPQTDSTPAPAASRTPAQPPTSRTPDDSIYDDIPSLENVAPGAFTSMSAGRAPPTARPDTDDEMPPLEQIPSSSPTRASGPTADSDDDMPPLEAIDDVPWSRPSVASSAAPARPTMTSAADGSDDDMSPLEPIDRPSATSGAPAAAAATAQSDEDSDGDGDDGDDDDDDEDWDDDDEDEEAESDEDEERTYPDGLPLDPLLPLLFINRPFLHASRKILYRKVHLLSAYQASRFRESLSSETPAAYAAGEELVGAGSDSGIVKKNYLADLVKHLWIEPEGLLSLGRGGGQVYIDIIRMCQYIETLVIRPQFLKSATKPLLEVLASLSRLNTIDFGSSADPKHPFRITTPRLYKLMQQSWLDLENLIVVDLRPAEDGPTAEEDEMWDLVDEFENDEWLRKREAEKPKKGEKKDSDGEAGESAEKKEDKETAKEKDDYGDFKMNKKRPHGLKSLQLFGFNLTGSEMDLILQDSRQTLQTLLLQKPGHLFSRYELASTLLTFGTHLTVLDLNLPANWDPAPKAIAGFPKPVFPVRPKDYKPGKTTSAHLSEVAEYTYVLDAVLGYLPNLKSLSIIGPYASTSIFSAFPPSLTHISFGRCPDIQPETLATLLNQTVTRQKNLTRADGSKYTKNFQTKVARGMTCLSVIDDDLSWSDAEIRAMEDATTLRNCCLHLSSDSPTGAGGVIPIPLNLGGLGGLFGGGLGAHGPAGGAHANAGGEGGAGVGARGAGFAAPPAAPRVGGVAAASAVTVGVAAPVPRPVAQPADANTAAPPANAAAPPANVNVPAPARANGAAAAPTPAGAGAGLAAGLAGLAGRWANNGGR
ncbi:hypothetical protein Rt10032_c05g2438 [Rhodotorula toruloides]|uniref:Uncharacterized protein n=1 Tax=Rhodotorula toruloides TaxID=5286 RepID=A0A511KDH2_RHOTO|nr:hypothetical protein Rt10032_c05g2438 [Rhodotorula toruloides]